MKKLFSVLLAMALCIALACPVFAAGEEFVASIEAKDHPDVVEAVIELDGVEEDFGKLVITPLSEAEESVPAEGLLLEIYELLAGGDMELPYEKIDGIDPARMVIRDLLDISLVGNYELPEGAIIKITFDLGVDADTDVVVMSYKNEEWNPIYKVENNGDGTVTCSFDHFCPVAIAVEGDAALSPGTGDNAGSAIWMWSILLVASVAAVSGLVVARKKVNN